MKATAWAGNIDWATLTLSNEHSEYLAWLTYALEWRNRHVTQDNNEKTYSMNGFQGTLWGGVAIGTSETHALFRVSGEVSHDAFFSVYQPYTNCSRLDLALTIWYEQDNGKTIQQNYRRVRRAIEQGAIKTRKCTIITNNDGGATLYVGKRTSECMIRVYNKAKESPDDKRYNNAIRYEIELKGDKASKAAKELWQGYTSGMLARTAVSRLIRNTVAAECMERNISIPFRVHGAVIDLTGERKRSDTDTGLEWLRKQVRPTVRRLIDAGYWREVMQALGLSELDNHIDE